MKFPLINQRYEISFALFSGGLSKMTVTWTRGYGIEEEEPFVEWGQKGEEKQRSFAATLTIDQNSVCDMSCTRAGAPAQQTVGWRDLSTVPVESHHTSTSALSTSQSPSLSSSKRTTRHESVVPQPKSPTQTNVADEAASTGMDVRHGWAATTVTSLDAGQGSDRVVALEIELQETKKVYGTAFTKLIKKVKKLEKTVKTRQARRKARIIVSDDEEDLKDPSKQGRKIAKIDQDPDISLVQHDAELVLTAGALVSTAGASSAKDKELFETTMRRVHIFVPMESKSEREIPELTAGSFKRDAEEELVQESPKRLKTKESLVPTKETKNKEEEELSQERKQQMMIIVPEQGMHVYQFFNDMLKAFDREDLVKLWSLVKEKFTSTVPTEDKEREIWVELKRLFAPDTLRHVSTKDGVDIYMLVEREYPLLRGVLTQMLVAKLLVEQDNEMSRELLRKIFMQVSNDLNCSSSCLENVKILKEPNEQLLKDLRTSKINAITYKTGLEFIEERLLVYKKNESVYEEDIKLLKHNIYLKEVAIIELKRKLELAQKQKDEIQLTVENFKNSSKNLSILLDYQIVDKCKTGLGYNAVPPPYTRNFMPPKPDLSFSGLEEFVNEPIVSEPTVEYK
ncbi:uncharacterized mitochondrial protein-like protein [Tanacetum coccineum]